MATIVIELRREIDPPSNEEARDAPWAPSARIGLVQRIVLDICIDVDPTGWTIKPDAARRHSRKGKYSVIRDP